MCAGDEDFLVTNRAPAVALPHRLGIPRLARRAPGGRRGFKIWEFRFEIPDTGSRADQRRDGHAVLTGAAGSDVEPLLAGTDQPRSYLRLLREAGPALPTHGCGAGSGDSPCLPGY